MRLLLCGGGASFSIKDVENGYLHALKRTEHQVFYYALDRRIDVAAGYLAHARQRAGLEGKPPIPDILYLATHSVLERALRFEVDWVLIISGMYFLPDFLILLKRAGFKTAVLFTESPYDTEAELRLAPLVDVCFTNERTSVAAFRQHNPHSYYLRHAYDAHKHKQEPSGETVPAHDVVFVGTGFIERCQTLHAADWRGVDFGLYGVWDLLGSRNRLRKHLVGSVIENEVAAELYRQAKIGLNLYRTSKGYGRHAHHVENAESLNPRALELAATGCFTLSDHRPEVEEVFGEAVPTFKDAKELTELVRYYLDNEAERERLASLLPDLAAGETYDARVSELLGRLRQSQGVRAAA